MLNYIILCSGGMGNHLGSLICGLNEYIKNDLKNTHNIHVLSTGTNTGDFIVSDILDFTNFNIIDFTKENFTFYELSEKDFNTMSFKNKNFLKENKIWKYDKKIYKCEYPYNPHIHQIPNSCKNKNILINSNVLPKLTEDYLKLTIKTINYFKLKLKKNILDKINNFVNKNNIDYNTLAIHYRGTDRLSSITRVKNNNSGNFDKYYDLVKMKMVDFDNTFILSEDETIERYISENTNGCFYKKETKTIKFPGLEEYDWYLTEKEREDIYNNTWLKNLKYNNIKVQAIGEFNIYRSKEQVIDGIIDLGILCYCGDSITNMAKDCSFIKFRFIMALLLFGVGAVNISWYKDRYKNTNILNLYHSREKLEIIAEDLFKKMIRMGVPYSIAEKQILKNYKS